MQPAEILDRVHAATGAAHSVSVLLPVYLPTITQTSIRQLRAAIHSVLQQTEGKDFELLIIDDGSAPTLEAHLADLLEPGKVQILRQRYNQGLVNALNVGLKAARKQLIARIDADDLWMEGKLNKQLACFRDDPDLTICATGMRRVDPQGVLIEDHVRPGSWPGVLQFFVDVGCPFPHGSVVGRADIFRLLGGYAHDAAVAHCEDYALWGTWLRFFKPVMVEEVLYSYTVSSSSVSSVHSQQQGNASRVVNARFASGRLSGRLPEAMATLARFSHGGLVQAGKIAYSLWHDRSLVRIPKKALSALEVVLFDRVFIPADLPPHSSTGVRRPYEQAQDGEWLTGRFLPIGRLTS